MIVPTIFLELCFLRVVAHFINQMSHSSSSSLRADENTVFPVHLDPDFDSKGKEASFLFFCSVTSVCQ